MELLQLTVVLALWKLAIAYACGNLQFSSSTVYESDDAELIYAYTSNNRYSPRTWYILRDKEYTKLYDTSKGSFHGWKYRERYQDNTFVLTISSVTLSDSGIYVLFCATDVNKNSGTAELRVIPKTTGRGACGRLNILNNGSPIGSKVQFTFETQTYQEAVIWQVEIKGIFRDLSFESRVELTNNAAHTLFVRKLYSTQSDAGIYRVRCHDGTISNIAEMAVHIVPPGIPIFEHAQSFLGCQSCLLAVPGRQLNIQCVSYNGSAPVDLNLYYKDVKISSAVSDSSRRSIVVQKQLVLHETDDNATVSCTAKNSAVDKPIVTVARIYLFREPAEPVIQGHKGIEGKLAAITCVSSGGKPAPYVQFLYNATFINPEIKQTVSKIDGTIRVDAVLYVNLTRSDNRRAIECRSKILQSDKKQRKVLEVEFPPKEVFIIKRYRVANPQGETNLTLRCQTGESNPKSTVIWQDLATIKRAPSGLPGTKGKYGGWYFKHDLNLMLTREDNRKVIKCIVLNSEFPELALEKTFQFDIPYQPIIIIIGSPNVTTYEGSDVTVTCDVDSNPIAKIRWLKEDVLIKESDNLKDSSLSLTLRNVSKSSHSTVLTCEAENGVGDLVVKNVILLVKDNSMAFRSASGDGGNEGTIAGVLIGLIFLVAIVTVTAIVLKRRKKRSQNSDFQSDIHILFENRQPSIQPPVEDPVYGNVTQPNSRVNETAEYAVVIPRSQRNAIDVVDNNAVRDGYAVVVPRSQLNTVDDEDNNGVRDEYAVVVPKSQGNSLYIVDNNSVRDEYAVVIPKSQRTLVDKSLNENQSPPQDSTSTANLVYAELDLYTPKDENNTDNEPKRQSATQYVSIDFVKSKDFNE